MDEKKGASHTEFEALYTLCHDAVERYVRFQVSNKADADDILQETWLTAFRKIATLRDNAAARAWIVSIARSRIADWYRKHTDTLPLCEIRLRRGIHGFSFREPSAVSEVLARLSENDRAILVARFYRELSYAEIAGQFGIPEGTVKSRLSAAREHFRALYPKSQKGDININMEEKCVIPEMLPEYTITPDNRAPFAVVWEEMMGWFIVPREGETCVWGRYDLPARKRMEWVEMAVTGRVQVHGIDGVSITAVEHEPMEPNRIGTEELSRRVFAAQVTDTHCRILAQGMYDGGIWKYYTFLDGEPFLANWGFGEDNCGNMTHPVRRGIVTKSGSVVTSENMPFCLDVVGRYTVTLGGRAYDTICIMDVETYNEGVVSEQYLDARGRTILWRRFNRYDWAQNRYGRPWTEILPDNERITVNGTPYVHWYDCITDAIL